MDDKHFKMNLEHDLAAENNNQAVFLQRTISLPNERVFMIGGATDL